MTAMRSAPPLRTWRPVVWTLLVALLLAPLAAMQLTRAVAWTASDFAAAAALLGTAGLAFEAVSRSPLGPTSKVVLLTLAGGAIALVWAQGAVGVF